MTFARWSLLAWALMLPMLCLLYLTVPTSPDQALFDYIAWSHIQGDFYYIAAAEQNWPGKMFIHELGIRVFGVHFWTFRAIDFVLLQCLTAMAMLFMYRAGFKKAPWIFLPLYPALYVTAGFWMAGQRDIIAMGFLVAAAALTLTKAQTNKSDVIACALAGALVFFAVIMRPTYLTFLAILMLTELGLSLRGKQRFMVAAARAFVMLGAFGVCLVGLLWLGAQIGALDDFYQQTILFNVESYQVSGPRSRLIAPLLFLISNSWHWIATLAAIGALLWVPTRADGRAFVLLAGLFVTVLISYFVQNKGFGYHLGGLLLLFTLLIGAALDRTLLGWQQTQSSRSRLLQGAILAGVVSLIMMGTGSKIIRTIPEPLDGSRAWFAPQSENADSLDWAAISQAVDMTIQLTRPDDFVLQWGRNFQIPYLAERRSTTRFISTPALYVMTPEFSGYDAWLAELARDLKAKQPALVIVTPDILGKLRSGAPATAPAETIILSHLADYDTVLSTDHIAILRSP